jgi:non-ribosomal peptide synthetase component F
MLRLAVARAWRTGRLVAPLSTPRRSIAGTPDGPTPNTTTTTTACHEHRSSVPGSPLTRSHVVGGAEPPLLDSTIYEHFAQQVQQFGDRPCVASLHQGACGRLTYAELDEAAARLATGFLSLGLRKGDRVAMWSFNSWEWVAMQVGSRIQVL